MDKNVTENLIKEKILLFFSVITLLTLIIFVINLYAFTISEEDQMAENSAINQFYTSLNDLDIEKTLSVCDSNTNNVFNSATSILQIISNTFSDNTNIKQFIYFLLPTLKNTINNNNIDFNIKPIAVELSPVDETHSTAKIKLNIKIYANGETIENNLEDTLRLTKENNEWKIDISEKCKYFVKQITNDNKLLK